MEQKPKEITDRQVYETSIGSVCMSKTEYAMYQEEMVKRIGKLCLQFFNGLSNKTTCLSLCHRFIKHSKILSVSLSP